MAIVTNDEIAAKVRGKLAERRISQSELATALHMSKMAVSRRTSGATPFTGAELSEVAAFLHIGVAALFESSGITSERSAA